MPLTIRNWLDQLLDFIEEDVNALGCAAEIARASLILAEGTSADRQIDIFMRARAAGRRRLGAINEVIDWVAAETQSSSQTKS
jgi:carboxylate-amine ligase